uniref:tRNA-dihydrouridine(16) synthase n=1 Tax=Azotobacter vinelandii TaxID=354 RepID=DUSC_AZOVI|nr:RecName: Full=tRNA-dihydrouridine(16) synthase; AltName: Full=U16-specific dihydrouridine synthase; Short=U16-specific Dus; AltName: Full=tRNA-dihydrouridine synthase C [Azotobacter vinelandii]CAA72146.1 Yoh1 protein [Azotobacter vinelandii]
MRIALAPMEGLVDELLRDLLTRVGGIDWCVTEFVRVCDRLLPVAQFEKLAPELRHGWRTRAGTPMHLQLLGSDPACLAENAALAAELGAPAIDLNFGCPAKTSTARGADGCCSTSRNCCMPSSARCAGPCRRCAGDRQDAPGVRPARGRPGVRRALVEGGVAHLVVHARTKVEGYRPPASWEWLARVREAVAVPVYANRKSGRRRIGCREISGVEDVMLGCGLVSRPDLARQIAMRAPDARSSRRAGVRYSRWCASSGGAPGSGSRRATPLAGSSSGWACWRAVIRRRPRCSPNCAGRTTAGGWMPCWA